MNKYQKEVTKITGRFLKLPSSKKNYRKARIEMRGSSQFGYFVSGNSFGSAYYKNKD